MTWSVIPENIIIPSISMLHVIDWQQEPADEASLQIHVISVYFTNIIKL